MNDVDDSEQVLPRVDPEHARRFKSSGSWTDLLSDSFITDVAAEDPSRMLSIDGRGILTYGELSASADRFAHYLRSVGVSPGDVVAFQLPNWNESFVVHHGILRSGGISAPIVPIYRYSELRYILEESRAKVVVVPDTFRGREYAREYERLQRDTGLERVITVGGSGPGTLASILGGERGHGELPGRQADDPAVLFYTSGTTGKPKGVLHTHNSLNYENQSIIDLMELTSDDVVFMPSPVTHITGLLYALQLPPMLGTRVVLQDVWDPTKALEVIQQEKCTFSVGATPFLHGITHHPDLAAYDVSSLRVFACGGADVAPELIMAAEQRLGCTAMRIYGSSEVPTVTGSGPDDPLEKRGGTDGHLIGAAEIRIVDEDGIDVGSGVVGEILARGPEQFVGYLGDDARPFDIDGWFHMGDLATMDADGYVQIQGRKKDIIVRGGENISVKEVEDLLFEHPSVREVAVVGYPDPVMAERACACVVLEPGTELTLDDVVRFLKGREIATQKIPERLEVLDELPKTASGKIQKFRLREQVTDAVHAGDLA